MSVTDIQLGPSVVLIRSLPDGEWVGVGPLSGPVEFEAGADVVPFMRRGPTPADVFHRGFGARVRTPVAQGSLEILERVIPGLVRGDDGEGLRYVGGGYVAVARKIQPVQLAIVPVQEVELGLDAPHAVHVWRAVPTIQSPLRWADVSEGIQSLTIEWIALRDATKPAGMDVFAIGPLRDVLTVPPEGEWPQDPPPELPPLEPPLYPGDSAPTLTVVDWNDGSAELLISPLQTSWPDPVLTGTRVQIVPRDAQDWIGSLIRDLVAHPDELLHIQIRGLPHQPMRARARHEYRSALPSLATEWSNEVQWGRRTVAGLKPILSLYGYPGGSLNIRAELPIDASAWGEIWQQCRWEVSYYRPGLGESEWAFHFSTNAGPVPWSVVGLGLVYLGPHYFRVRVRQSGPPGDVYSEWSDPLVSSPGWQDLYPSLSTQEIGAGQAMLQWYWTTQLPAVEYWEIQRRFALGGDWGLVGTYADPGNPGLVWQFIDSGLAIGGYYYRVRGWRDGQPTAWSNESWVNITQSAPINPWVNADLDPGDLNDVHTVEMQDDDRLEI